MNKIGLCQDCQHVRLINTANGSTFYLCELSKTDQSFPRYPRLPVSDCLGYQKKPEVKRMAMATGKKNLDDALGLAGLMRTLDDLSKPTIARVQGPAYGGGVGLIAACDIAIACREAAFALSEVRLGLIPAVIGPYVILAMGARRARRYFLTGERFDAAEAYRIGLVHDICEMDDLDGHVQLAAGQLLMGGPKALAAAKKLIADAAPGPLDGELSRDRAARIAELRAGDEGEQIGNSLDQYL